MKSEKEVMMTPGVPEGSLNLTQKIIAEHLVHGNMVPGEEIAIKVDQALLQDATGTLVALQFEQLGISRIRTEFAIAYVDHNVLQTGFENPDDHIFLQTFCKKYGLHFSKPGNGICHQVHLERFVIPGKTMLGSDSHTSTAGGLGMLAIGVGGLNVALALSGRPFFFKMPKVMGIKLTGELKPWVTAHDVVLALLKKFSVKGGVGKVFEFYGPGLKNFNATERATVTNFCVEMGPTTSIFPSDELTKEYLKLQKREKSWRRMEADAGAKYDEDAELDLSKVEPMIAMPSSPDNVVPLSKVLGKKVDQVIVGSCTNSSLEVMDRVAQLLKGKKSHQEVDFHVVPGSKMIVQNLVRTGAFQDIVDSGARFFEPACDGCVGIGSAPGTGWFSLRSFNRNFPGRTGTKEDKLALASPEICVAAALTGKLTDPKKLFKKFPKARVPKNILIDDSMIVLPASEKEAKKLKVVKGPNIKPLPAMTPLAKSLKGRVLMKLGENISTDGIIPGGATIMSLRSNIEALSNYLFYRIDPTFPKRARELKGGIIVAGENYGQGSSREHAAVALLNVGVHAVLVKSFARIHRNNLINFGMLPLTFKDAKDYDKIKDGTLLEIPHAREELKAGKPITVVINGKAKIEVNCDVTDRERNILLAGGMLAFLKEGKAPKHEDKEMPEEPSIIRLMPDVHVGGCCDNEEN